MTEREKMISGELYDPTDKELEQFLISPAWMYVKYIQEWSYVKKKYKLNTTNFLFLCNC